jgi:hypothetical protein
LRKQRYLPLASAAASFSVAGAPRFARVAKRTGMDSPAISRAMMSAVPSVDPSSMMTNSRFA